MITTRKQEALQATMERLTANAHIQDIVTLEPAVLPVLATFVGDYDGEYWPTYERMKQVLSRYAGWDASRTVLRTQAHYEGMIDLVCAVLDTCEQFPITSNGVIQQVEQASGDVDKLSTESDGHGE